jgi:hypothetical protein
VLSYEEIFLCGCLLPKFTEEWGVVTRLVRIAQASFQAPRVSFEDTGRQMHIKSVQCYVKDSTPSDTQPDLGIYSFPLSNS